MNNTTTSIANLFERTIQSALNHIRTAVICLCLCLLAGCATPNASGPLALRSPDGKIEVRLMADGPLNYAVSVDGRRILTDSRLGLKFRDGVELGRDVEVVKAIRSSTDKTWEDPFGKRRQVRDHYNELRLALVEKSSGKKFEVIFRAFNDGIGFRYTLPSQPAMELFVLEQEQTEFAFPGNYPCFAPAKHG